MKKQDNLKDELREVSPFLHDLKQKDDGFRLPENYFEQMESDFFKNIDAIGARRMPQKTAPAGWWAWLAQFWQPRLAWALAGILVLAVAGWWHFGKPTAATDTQMAIVPTVDLTEEDAEAFVMANAHEFEPAQLAPENPEELPHYLQESPYQDTDITPKEIEHLLEEMSDEELEELVL